MNAAPTSLQQPQYSLQPSTKPDAVSCAAVFPMQQLFSLCSSCLGGMQQVVFAAVVVFFPFVAALLCCAEN
ncbi:unnamed protein product [Amaranthus hypochondriacus]